MKIKILHMVYGAKKATGTTVVIDVFPEVDFHVCVEDDKFDFIVKLEKGEGGISYMRKYCKEGMK